MPKTRTDKEALVDEIVQTLESRPVVYLTNYSGLSVAQASELRNRFRESGVEYRVYKNTLIRLAMERIGGYDELIDQLNGPTAVAFAEEPAAPARVIKKFVSEKSVERPELKAAYVDGAFFAADALDALAALKSKDELLGDILGLLMSPMNNVVSAIQAPASTLAGAIRAIAEEEEQAEA